MVDYESSRAMTWERVLRVSWLPCATNRHKHSLMYIFGALIPRPTHPLQILPDTALAPACYKSTPGYSTLTSRNSQDQRNSGRRMSSHVLSVRDNNAQIKPTPSPEKEKPKSLEYHRQVLQSRMDSEQYVKPAILKVWITNMQPGPSHTFPRLMRSCLQLHKSCKLSRPSTA